MYIESDIIRGHIDAVVLHFLKDNDLSDNVIYLGIIKGEQKKLAFRESDVFGFPSYFHSESFPLVLIEAMSYGLPIISTKWRGIVEMVEDGINGYLVDIKSPYVLAEKFKLLFENVGLRQELGRNARDLFIKNYEIHRHLQLMENLFENV